MARQRCAQRNARVIFRVGLRGLFGVRGSFGVRSGGEVGQRGEGVEDVGVAGREWGHAEAEDVGVAAVDDHLASGEFLVESAGVGVADRDVAAPPLWICRRHVLQAELAGEVDTEPGQRSGLL